MMDFLMKIQSGAKDEPSTGQAVNRAISEHALPDRDDATSAGVTWRD